MASDEAVANAMSEALDLAATGPRSENPRVGCVILDAGGAPVGRGAHQGAGTAHAEVVALHAAGAAARRGTAVVTLEPCTHTGRTGPCTAALIDAGITRVVYAIPDPTPTAGGGAQVLRDSGIEVEAGVMAERAAAINRDWLHLQRTGAPLVTAKVAVSLDGRVAGPGGERLQLTGAESHAWVHRLRAEVDAILVGTGTAAVDNPRLTARLPQGGLAASQPLRVVVGRRDLDPALHVLDGSAPTLQVRSHDPEEVVRLLAADGARHILLEGGPRLLRAFLEAGAVHRIAWFIAPVLLGAGPVALPEALPGLLPDGGPWAVDVESIARIGDDVLVEGAIARP